MQNIIAQLEALLFIYGEPLEYKKIAKILNISTAEVKGAATELRSALENAGRGLTLVDQDEMLQLATKSEFGALLETVLKQELREQLSPASLEVLAIVTYAGPIARAEVDYIRGVNSTFSIRSLLLRGLISRDQDPHRGNAYIYKPSLELIRHLGITSTAELPEYERFRTLVTQMRQPALAPSSENDSSVASS